MKRTYNVDAVAFNPVKSTIIDEECKHVQHHPPYPYSHPHPPVFWGPAPPYHPVPPPPPYYQQGYWRPPPPILSVQPPLLEAAQPISSGNSNVKVEIIEKRDQEIQTDTIKEDVVVEEKEHEVKKRCNCRCIHTDVYPIPKSYSPEEANLWKKIRPPTKLARVSNVLCVGEPNDLAFVRNTMLEHKFKLEKENITDTNYYIKSVKTPETDPSYIGFQVYYKNDNIMPYKTVIYLKNRTKIQEYDTDHNCRLKSKIMVCKDKKISCKQTFDYAKKEKTLEVMDLETFEVKHIEVLTGQCWLENDFKFR